MTNLINCGTCGYPLTPEERTSLIERDGVMVKPAPMTKDQVRSTEEALDLAQGYLDRLIRGLNMDDTSEAVQVRDAIKQARSAFVQEPVACGYDETTGNCTNSPCCYTTPPAAQRQWVGLTDEEIEKLTVELRDIPVTLAFAIEAKLRSKNT